MTARTDTSKRTHVVDPDGDVWALTCDCAAHADDGVTHAARPVGNVHRDADLAARVGWKAET